MNEVAKRSAGTEVGSITTNYFQSYGDQVSQRSIVGQLLKFSKGDYLIGQDNEDMKEGTQLVANMDELMVGWLRWEDNKPTDQIMGRVTDGYQPPRRNELGDDDKSKWEIDNDGHEKDPWQFSNYLIMKSVEGDEIYTFTTSSKGGLSAIGELCKTYGKAMRQRPAEFPIVSLGVDSYQHSNKAFGRIKVPLLTVVGWASKAEFAEALSNETADSAPAEEEAPKAAAKASGGKGKASTAASALAGTTRF